MPVPSRTIAAWSRPAAAPWRCSASNATFASLSTCTGKPEPLAHEVAERDTLERKVRGPRARRRSPGRPGPGSRSPPPPRREPPRGSPPLPRRRCRASPGGRRRATSDAPGGAPQAPRPRRRRAASCHPRRRRLHASAAWPDDIQGLVNDPPRARPTPAPPNTTSTGRVAGRRAACRAEAISTRSGSGSRASASASRAEPGERRGITPGRVLKWIALAVPDGCCSRSCCSS